MNSSFAFAWLKEEEEEGTNWQGKKKHTQAWIEDWWEGRSKMSFVGRSRKKDHSLESTSSSYSASPASLTMIKNRTDNNNTSSNAGNTLTSGIIKLRKESSMTPVTLSPDDEDDLDGEEGGREDEERDENTKWNKQTSSVGTATDTGRPVIQSSATRSLNDPPPLTSGSTITGVSTSLSTTTTSRVIKLFKKSP